MSMLFQDVKHEQQHDDLHIWDVRSVRALLHAHTWKLNKDPWAQWMQHRGGVEAVRSYLKTCPLSADYQELLHLVLSQPGENVHFYISHWRPMHRATFADYVTKLCTALANHLNTWALKEAELAYSEQALRVPSRPRLLKNLPAPVTSFLGRHQELLSPLPGLVGPEKHALRCTLPSSSIPSFPMVSSLFR
jgi:hypothetical protein